VPHARSTPAPPAYPQRPQARAAAREPGAAVAAGVRGPALDRCRDAGPARQPGGEPAHGPAVAPGQLSLGVPARLGQQDLLHATAPRPAPASADAFLQALLGDDLSLMQLKHLLIARTEGNPFFLEESVRTLVETGVLVGAPGGYRLTKSLDGLHVP